LNYIFTKFPFLKDPNKNPFGIILITIISLIILGFVILLFISYGQSGLGILNYGFSINEIYCFDNLELEGEYINFKIDEAGYLIPGYKRDMVYCIVVLGEGNFHLKTPTDDIENSFKALYIPLQPKDYLYLRENLILNKTCNAPTIEAANKIMRENNTAFFYAKPFNQIRTYPPSSDNLLSVIYTEDYGKVKYIEAKNVVFKPETGKKITFKHEQDVPAYPPIRVYNCLGIGILGMTSILLIAAFVVTLDIAKKTGHENYVFIDPKTEWGVFSALTLSYLLVLILSKAYNLNIEIFLYLVAAALSIFIKFKQGYDLKELGFNWDYPLRNFILGTTLGILGFFMGTLHLPQGFHPIKLSVLLLPLIISLCREIISRSFIQTTLEKYIGQWAALIATSLLSGVPYLAYGLFYIGSEPEIWLNSLLAIPSVSLIAGYIFIKTRSILGGTIFNAVLMILSSILIY